MAVADKITYTSTPEQVESMHNAFDIALEDLRGELGQTYPLLIGGEERAGADTFEVRSPADNEIVIGRFAAGTEADVNDAVAAAKAAFPAWSQRPWQERVAIMRRAAALIREQKFRLAALLILEAGKNRIEAIGEVEEAADIVDTYAAQVEANDGFVRRLDALDPAERNRSVLRPFGVWAVLAPFNFPHALSVGMSSGALLAGNTVVYKPASATPLSGYELARIYAEAGIPAGVFNYVSGSGEAVGDPLTHHPDVDGVVFTGSREVGWELYKDFSTDFPKPCITELGGKNPTIVTRNADLDKAVEGVARSAFGYSGQKCSACSRVYVEEPVYDEFMERLTQRTKELVVGDPTDRDTYVGPVIDERAVRRYEEALASAQGGQVRTGGQRLHGGIFDRGTYVAPTVVDGLPLDHRAVQEGDLPALCRRGAGEETSTQAHRRGERHRVRLDRRHLQRRSGGDRQILRSHRSGRRLCQSQGRRDHRRLARLPVICRLESLRQHRQRRSGTVLRAAVHARAEPDGRRRRRRAGR